MRRAASTVTVGEELPPITIDVSRTRLVDYAAASGDHNRIHWDEPFAKSVGLPDVIAHGMFTMGAAIECAAAWAGDPGAVVEYSTRFTKPVVVDYAEGARIQVSGVVKALDGHRATVLLTVTSAGEQVLGKCQAVVALA